MPKCEMCGVEYNEGETHTCKTSTSENTAETQASESTETQ